MQRKTFLEKEIERGHFKWINMDNKAFLQELLHELATATDSHKLHELGETFYRLAIPFNKLAIFLDRFSYTLDLETKKRLQTNENHFAHGYIQARLPNEIATLEQLIHNNDALISKEDLAIIEELLHWLELLITAILHDQTPPPLDDRHTTFIEFVEQKEGLFFEEAQLKANFLETNKELYECAKELLKLYEAKEFYYFCICYVDFIALFLKMCMMLGSMFLETELLSIYIDPITHLPNRFQLVRDLHHIQDVWILLLNIRSFAKLNVLYGFEEGDRILKLVANHLKRSDAIKVYRIYGDEFALLFEKEEEIEHFYKTLALSTTIDEEEYPLYLYGAYDRFGPKALEGCEFALAQGEKRGLVDANSIKELITHYQKELTMIQKLREALIHDDIIPYYQPIYVKENQKVIKYEVLMRVKYKEQLLSPADFIPTLLESPFYTEFTKSILLKSFSMFENNDLTFSINFTPKDLKDKGLMLFFTNLIKRYPDVAKRLTIEITENEALNEFDLINSFIQKYKRYGITFSLDDFGSGYSNFAQVAKLDIDYIKVDGSIIQGVLTDPKLDTLLDSIVTFAHNFDIKVIGEYISTKELFDYLKEKLDMLQGYYIGEPEPFLPQQSSSTHLQNISSKSSINF